MSMNRINAPQTNTLAAKNAFVVTPHDTNELVNFSARGLYIGTAGDLTVTMVGAGEAVLFQNVPVGTLDVIVRRVHATGTTAADIVALY